MNPSTDRCPACLLIILLIECCVIGAAVAEQPIELGIAEEKLREELETARLPVGRLVTSYRTRLETLKKLAQDRGKLDDVILVDAELKRLADGEFPVAELEAFDELKSARQLFGKSVRTLLAKEQAEVRALLSKFEAHLRNVEVKVTQSGRVEEAKAIRHRLTELAQAKSKFFRVAEPLILIAAPNKSKIDQAYPDGSHAKTLLTLKPSIDKKKPEPLGLATYDGHLYWTDRKRFGVHRARLDGTNERRLVDMRALFGKKTKFSLKGIAVSDDRLYWICHTQDSIYTARTDGGNARVLISLDRALGKSDYDPHGIAIAGSRLYWTDSAKNGIFTAGIDGSEPRVLINPQKIFGGSGYTPMGITVSGSKLFWVDNARQWVYSVNLDGTAPKKLINLDEAFGAAGYQPVGIVAFQQRLYWADAATDMVYSAKFDGSDPKTVLKPPSTEASWITAAPLFQD